MRKKNSSSKAAAAHKLGANRQDTAKRERKLDKNFKQSKDVREDRGVRKLKTNPKNVRRESR
jgi:hypothetical protein